MVSPFGIKPLYRNQYHTKVPVYSFLGRWYKKAVFGIIYTTRDGLWKDRIYEEEIENSV